MSRLPIAERYPGVMDLKRRSGGSFPSAGGSLSTYTGLVESASKGSALMAPTRATPAIVSIFRRIASSIRITFSGSLTWVAGMPMRTVSIFEASEKPGFSPSRANDQAPERVGR